MAIIKLSPKHRSIITKLDCLKLYDFSSLADVFMIVAGFKKITDFDFFDTDKVTQEEVISLFESLGLIVEFEPDDPEWTIYEPKTVKRIVVTKDKKLIQEIRKLKPLKDHLEYGMLMNYPMTAVTAFTKQYNWDERTENDGLDLMLPSKNFPDNRIEWFAYSKEHFVEELAYTLSWDKFLHKYAPNTYWNLIFWV